MKENIRWVTWAVALLALLGVVAEAHAAALPPGSVDVSVTNLGSFTGTLVADTNNINYSFGANTGTLREWVVSNGTSALCPGCLAFVYQFHVTTGDVGRISASSYDAFTIDVSHTTGPSVSLPGSLAGIFGANNADRTASGTTIDFDFTSPVTAGFNSFVLIANTNSTAFQPGIMFLNDIGATSGNIAGFAPGQAATVPEPATVLLVGSGVVALGVWRRRS
jgi:hypothetical protein